MLNQISPNSTYLNRLKDTELKSNNIDDLHKKLSENQIECEVLYRLT